MLRVVFRGHRIRFSLASRFRLKQNSSEILIQFEVRLQVIDSIVIDNEKKLNL